MDAVEVIGRNNKDSRTTSIDRISGLPSEVIDHILQLLPLKDAARTSTLSSHWRFKWALLPQLILDPSFFSGTPKLKGKWKATLEELYHGSITSLHVRSLDYSKLVSDVLLRHFGPIHRFVLYIPNWLPDDADISHWLQFVSGKSVKEFTLYKEFSLLGNRELPSCVFSFVGFKDLTHLTLENLSICSLPSRFTGFPCLVSLHLSMFMYESKANNVGALVSKCPQLKSIFVGLRNVKTCLNLSAPKLEKLHLAGCFTEICLVETNQQIKALYLEAIWEHESDIMAEFITCLPHIEKLLLGGNFWLNYKFLSTEVECPEKFKLPCELRQLKHLMINIIILVSPRIISFLYYLFQTAPNLEKLHINISILGAVDRFLAVEDDCCFHHLKFATVRFSLHCSWVALPLVKLILSSSPILEVITIEPVVKTTNARVQAEEKLQIAKELLQYHRASTSVQINFKT